MMIASSGNATIDRKTISGLNHITKHQLQIMSLIRLCFIYQCCIISHHAIHNQIWKRRYGFYLNKKRLSSLPWRPGRNYAVVLCKDFRGNLLVLFWTVYQSVKGPCEIMHFKISTAYGVWFLRYRPSNMKLATDSALVLVFKNFLWAVYNGCCAMPWWLFTSALCHAAVLTLSLYTKPYNVIYSICTLSYHI